MDPSRSKFENPQENLNLGLEASEYIHNNYYREITLQSVADYLNISPRRVNRFFYGMFGTTFSKALTLLRFSYAKKIFVHAWTEHQKSFLCRCLKNDKTASLFLLGKRFLPF